MKILIVEDEIIAADRLRRMLIENISDTSILDVCISVDETVDFMRLHGDQVDLVLLDIHLADGSSFEIFHEIEISCPVIFTTAYDHYAVDAFRQNAIDYLLKPIKKEELVAAVRKAKISIDQNDIVQKWTLLQEKEQKSKRLFSTFGNRFHAINLDEIRYIYSRDKISYAVFQDASKVALSQTLEELMTELNDERFFRLNRQIIVTASAIGAMFKHSKSRLRVGLVPDHFEEVIVSTNKTPLFKEWLKRI